MPSPATQGETTYFFSANSISSFTKGNGDICDKKEAQKQIYCVTADGKEKAKMSPAAEKVRSRGYEVLYLTEPLDAIMIESATIYKTRSSSWPTCPRRDWSSATRTRRNGRKRRTN